MKSGAGALGARSEPGFYASRAIRVKRRLAAFDRKIRSVTPGARAHIEGSN